MVRAFVAAILLTVLTAGSVAAQTPREHLDAMRHLRLGQENLRAEQWEKANAEFQAAIVLEPTLEMAHYGLGQVKMATRRFPEAVVAYLACRDAFIANNARRAVNDLAAQRQLDDQIRSLEDQKAALGSGRGNVLAGSQHDLERHIADLRLLQSRSKGTSGVPPWISVALGSAYFRSGSMNDAEREYLEALKADPKLGEAHNNLAVVYLSNGRYHEAQVEIDAAEKAAFHVNPQLKEDLKKASVKR